MRSLVFAVLVLSACTDTDTKGGVGRTQTTTSTPTPSCVAACRVALDACGDTADDRDQVADCAAQCPFTSAERTCLSNIACGDDTAACY